jgi:hypothetical protein
MPAMRGLPTPRPRLPEAQAPGSRTWPWAALFLLQELALPGVGSLRTLAPFLLASAPGCLLLSAVAAVIVIALHGFNVHVHLLVSLTVLLTPFALISTNRIALNIEQFARTVIGVLFGACLAQALLPGLSNVLFAPFLNGYLSFGQLFERATGLSMEPSFAAEMLFAAAMVHFFFAPRFWSPATLMLLGALLLVRASTSVQQALLFALVYGFLGCARLATATAAHRNRANLALGLLAGLFALCAILFGYSLVTYGRLDLSFMTDSMDRFHSWRTVSNYAAYLSAQPIAFFPYDTDAGWDRAISGTLHLYRISGDDWVTQPFSAIGVALLDLGLAGAALWIALVYAAAVRRLRPYALDTAQAAIVYTLLANAIFLAPKWQSSGFLAIGLIAATIDSRNANRSGRAARPDPGPASIDHTRKAAGRGR